MATIAWLYNIAATRPKVPKVEIVVDLPVPKWYNTQQQVHDVLRSMIDKAAMHLDQATARWGLKLGHSSNHVLDMVLTMIVGLILVAIFLIQVNRRMRNRALHKQRYGKAVFPPLAPGGIRTTVSALTHRNPNGFFQKCAEMVGPVFRINVPFVKGPMVVAVGDLQLATRMLNDPRTVKPESFYTSIASIAGGKPNILTSEGSKWKMSRHGMKSVFDQSHLKRMHHVCKVKTEEWIRGSLDQTIRGNESFDVGKEMVFLTLSILCAAAFEYRMDRKEAEPLVEEFNIAIREFAYDQGNSPLRTTFGLLLSSGRRARLARSRVHAAAKKMLMVYRKRQKKRCGKEQDVTIINCIVNNKGYKNDDHRVADIVMLLFAGLDSTAYSLSWTLLELARNKNELADLREALNGNDDTLAHTKLKDILREGMRLHPVVPGIGVRTVRKDFFIHENSVVIPKGSHVIFPSSVLTRHKVEDAEEFRPSRWREHPDKSFLLFSAGHRNCVAQGLALAEMTWVLSRVCAEYDFEIVDEGETEFCVTTKCIGTRFKATRTLGELNMSLSSV